MWEVSDGICRLADVTVAEYFFLVPTEKRGLGL